MRCEKRDERHEVRWVSADDSGGLVDGRCLLPHETGKASALLPQRQHEKNKRTRRTAAVGFDSILEEEEEDEDES
jgi:hypothetical protein